MYWKYTDEDIETRLKLKLSFVHTQGLQMYEALAIVLSQALGGSKDKKEASNFAQAEADFKSVFGK